MSVRIVLAAAGVLALAGCASPPAPISAPPAAPAPAPVAAAAPPPISLPPAPISVPPARAPDQCGAYLLAGLVGQSRTKIPVPVDPARRRVVCDTCPRTEDLRPDRLTIEYEAATGKVIKVGCN